MGFRLVPRQESDFDRLYLLGKAAAPLEWDYDRAFERCCHEHSRRFDTQAGWVIEDAAGNAVGSAMACIGPEKPSDASLDVTIHPGCVHEARDQAAEAYDKAMEWARERGAERFSGWTSDRTLWRLEFWLERGYRRGCVESCSVLELTTWDPERFREKTLRAHEAGVELITMADPGAPAREDIPALINRAEQSMPSATEWTDSADERVLHRLFEGPYYDPRLFHWAKVDGQWAGLSLLTQWSPDSAIQDDTAVFEEFRRRGIAWALKIRLTTAAKQAGLKRLVTWNEVGNQGMLAVNRQMGYEHRLHTIQMLLGHDEPTE
jgi:GNAT superfamily N-acetyltransferase